MSVLQRYEALKTKVTNRESEFQTLITFMEKKTAWLTSPASSRFHLNKEGGLLEHSVNVAETMLKIKVSIAPEITDESCVIVSLLHDLGKVGMPQNPYYLVNEPSEKQQRAGYKPNYPYRANKDLVYLSVPVRSLYLALQFIHLTEEEVQAIVYHDGQYVDDNKSVATKEEPLTLLLQYADSWSGFEIEKET
ncbi:MAG: phosphohydrolase [Spirochaetia bacterium]|nr:phosphohydrolase [Spirochaetia bacterium]